MGNEKGEMVPLTVRLPPDDYAALESEAKTKQMALAAYIRDLLQAHLLKRDFSDQFESEFERVIVSGKYDDKIAEVFLRAYGNLKK